MISAPGGSAGAAALTATVGLLFSDIEGSTRLLQQLGPDYPAVLLAHRELLRAAFAAHGGDEQGTEGDSFFVTFPAASDAVAAALGGPAVVGGARVAARRNGARADGSSRW